MRRLIALSGAMLLASVGSGCDEAIRVGGKTYARTIPARTFPQRWIGAGYLVRKRGRYLPDLPVRHYLLDGPAPRLDQAAHRLTWSSDDDERLVLEISVSLPSLGWALNCAPGMRRWRELLEHDEAVRLVMAHAFRLTDSEHAGLKAAIDQGPPCTASLAECLQRRATVWVSTTTGLDIRIGGASAMRLPPSARPRAGAGFELAAVCFDRKVLTGIEHDKPNEGQARRCDRGEMQVQPALADCTTPPEPWPSK